MRRHAAETEALYYLYVLDSLKRLVGVVSLRELLAAEDSRTVRDIMTTRVVSVRDDADQEEAARTLQTYDLAALPVVDDRHRLLGVITFDDVLDVLQEEGTTGTRPPRSPSRWHLWSPLPPS